MAAVVEELPEFVDAVNVVGMRVGIEHGIGFTVVNGENTNVVGITPKQADALFRAGAWIVLVAGVLAAGMAPMLGQFAPIQFSHDFIVVAYTLGLARIALMISAMDVGSSFEGMGTAREAAFSTYAEPALFLLIGTASAATRARAGTGAPTRARSKSIASRDGSAPARHRKLFGARSR